MDDQKAIQKYLAEWSEGDRWISSLEAALRDARQLKDREAALWLATLAYLIVLEQIGTWLARPATKFPDRGGQGVYGKRFRTGVLEFGPDPTDKGELYEVLWALRCSQAHGYRLDSDRNRVFVLGRTGKIVRHPLTPWDGTVEKARLFKCQTVVNIEAVWGYSESVVKAVRDEFVEGRVVLAPGVTAEKLDLFGGFLPPAP